jgi:hypothetical protein
MSPIDTARTSVRAGFPSMTLIAATGDLTPTLTKRRAVDFCLVAASLCRA